MRLGVEGWAETIVNLGRAFTAGTAGTAVFALDRENGCVVAVRLN